MSREHDTKGRHGDLERFERVRESCDSLPKGAEKTLIGMASLPRPLEPISVIQPYLDHFFFMRVKIRQLSTLTGLYQVPTVKVEMWG
ncbi:MAG: hypothetical protein ACXQTE_05835 [Methanosarcinaceae archaeon]